MKTLGAATPRPRADRAPTRSYCIAPSRALSPQHSRRMQWGATPPSRALANNNREIGHVRWSSAIMHVSKLGEVVVSAVKTQSRECHDRRGRGTKRIKAALMEDGFSAAGWPGVKADVSFRHRARSTKHVRRGRLHAGTGERATCVRFQYSCRYRVFECALGNAWCAPGAGLEGQMDARWKMGYHSSRTGSCSRGAGVMDA